MNDLRLYEELAKVNRRVRPERVLFAKGAGAWGKFFSYMNMEDYTVADFLCNTNMETPVFVRFSLESGGRGAADTIRDNRGFAVRFYSEEGNYDLMGISLPVFYISNAGKMMELICALKPSMKTNIRDPEIFWRFYADNPEAIHLITWLYTDSGTVKSYRTMAGYGVIPHLWIGRDGTKHLVRSRWRPMAGEKTISSNEAEFLAGFDPDVAGRDLYNALDEGVPIEYELEIQMAPLELALQSELDLLNPTLIWEDKKFPPLKVGKMILEDGPEDYEEEVEGIGFSPGNLVRGINLTGDPIGAMCAFACRDSHFNRLGRDYGKMAVNTSKTASIDESEKIGIVPSIKGSLEKTIEQAGERLKSMGLEARRTLALTIAQEILFIDERIQWEIVGHFNRVHEGFANMVAGRIGI
ncbi:MAG: catalase [Anaerovoracaceae bacterium]|jgi:catalase